MVEIDMERVGRAVAFVLHEGSSVAPHCCRRSMTRLRFCWQCLFKYYGDTLESRFSQRNRFEEGK